MIIPIFDESYTEEIKVPFSYACKIVEEYYSWVYVTVKNEYGSDRRTLEFAPSYGNADIAGTPLSAITTAIQLYAIDGHIVFEGTPADFSDKTFQPGIYIKKDVLNDCSYKTSNRYIKSEDFSR